MSGVSVINYLLSNDSPTVAVVPAARIFTGVGPLETSVPTIVVQQISGTERLTVSMAGAKKMHTDRVQVTALAKAYSTVKAILALARIACANRNGTVNSIDLDSILPDIEGPDLYDAEDLIYSQTQDFLVKYRI